MRKDKKATCTSQQALPSDLVFSALATVQSRYGSTARQVLRYLKTTGQIGPAAPYGVKVVLERGVWEGIINRKGNKYKLKENSCFAQCSKSKLKETTKNTRSLQQSHKRGKKGNARQITRSTRERTSTAGNKRNRHKVSKSGKKESP